MCVSVCLRNIRYSIRRNPASFPVMCWPCTVHRHFSNCPVQTMENSKRLFVSVLHTWAISWASSSARLARKHKDCKSDMQQVRRAPEAGRCYSWINHCVFLFTVNFNTSQSKMLIFWLNTSTTENHARPWNILLPEYLWSDSVQRHPDGEEFDWTAALGNSDFEEFSDLCAVHLGINDLISVSTMILFVV